MLRAVATPTPAAVGTWQILDASAVAVSHTGSTTETVLATISIPAAAMGPNGLLRVSTVWSFNGASGKTPRIRLGGAAGDAFLSSSASTSVLMHDRREIANRNSEASQIGSYSASFGSAGGWGTLTSGSLVTSTVDTSTAQDLVISGQLVDGLDTISLESYLVELFYQA